MALSGTMNSAFAESIPHLPSVAALLLGIWVLYRTLKAIYNITFHPLAHFPGPKSAAATEIPRAKAVFTGEHSLWVTRLHERYGEVVRIGPNELSFITETAWKDIYMHRQGHPEMSKADRATRKPNGVDSIITANAADHQRQRKLLSHAFSEKALKEQDDLIISYIDLLIEKLQEKIKSGKSTVDLVSWYNYTSFDVIGDLTYGESFHGLESGEVHPWIKAIFLAIKTGAKLGVGRWFPPVLGIVEAFLPPSIRKIADANFTYAKKKVQARLNMQTTERPDFMSSVLKYNDEKGMSRDEIDSSFAVLTVAGSETTATLLSGCTFHLMKNRSIYDTLRNEIRTAFSSPDEITMQSTASLPYLKAVIDESLRIYPPVPIALPRVVPGVGETISGQYVPGSTVVGIPQYAAYHSPRNFIRPDEFIPERWMAEHAETYKSDRKAICQPFSAGPRNCIGKNLAYAEIRMILAKMLWWFDIESVPGYENWVDQKVYILWEKTPLLVKLSLRQ